MRYETIEKPIDLKKLETFVVPFFSDLPAARLGSAAPLARAFGVDLKKAAAEERFTGADAEELVLRLCTGGKVRRLILVGFGKQRLASTFLIKRRMQRAGQIVSQKGYRDPVLFLPDYPPAGISDGTEAALLGFTLGLLETPRYKTSPKKRPSPPRRVLVFRAAEEGRSLKEIGRTADILSSIVARVRDMVNDPANVVGPEELAARVTALVEGTGVQVALHRVGGEADGFPLIWWVGRASARKPLLLELTWRPEPEGTGRKVLIVGKGIVFDSGGLNIKQMGGMANMKDDMAGAAAVGGAIAAAAALGVRTNVTALLPIAENSISGEALRPGDIITSRAGKTVEIISTDAEGRLILADALAYGVEGKPDYVVDLATLTGSCVVALGPLVAGLFASDDALGRMIEESARAAGEPLWRMPLVEEMMGSLRGDMADLRNALSDPYGGAIGAALFLREFTKGLPWAHLDIAGPAFYEKRSEVGLRGATGFGVHLLVKLLQRLSTDGGAR